MNNKRIIITSLVGVVTLLAAVVGATFAYFSIDGMSNTSASVNVTIYTSEILTF